MSGLPRFYQFVVDGAAAPADGSFLAGGLRLHPTAQHAGRELAEMALREWVLTLTDSGSITVGVDPLGGIAVDLDHEVVMVRDGLVLGAVIPLAECLGGGVEGEQAVRRLRHLALLRIGRGAWWQAEWQFQRHLAALSAPSDDRLRHHTVAAYPRRRTYEAALDWAIRLAAYYAALAGRGLPWLTMYYAAFAALSRRLAAYDLDYERSRLLLMTVAGAVAGELLPAAHPDPAATEAEQLRWQQVRGAFAAGWSLLQGGQVIVPLGQGGVQLVAVQGMQGSGYDPLRQDMISLGLGLGKGVRRFAAARRTRLAGQGKEEMA